MADYKNYSPNTTIDAGSDNDSIENYAANVMIIAAAGNDSISNYGVETTINAGLDSDFISNNANSTSISAGDGNDTINNSGGRSTINAGLGDDYYTVSSSDVIEYSNGDGNDIIQGATRTNKLYINNGKVSKVSAETNLVIAVGSGSLTFVDSANVPLVVNDATINGNVLVSKIPENATVFTATDADDSINHNTTGNHVLIHAGAGNDTINIMPGDTLSYQNNDGDKLINLNGNDYSNALIYSAVNITGYTTAGPDQIIKLGAGTITLKAASPFTSKAAVAIDFNNNSYMYVAGNQFLRSTAATSYGDYLTNSQIKGSLYGGAGNDYLKNYASSSTINAGNDNDTIENSADLSNLIGGNGDDLIQNSGYQVSILAGDGKDIIENSGANVTINGGKGNDIIFNNFINKPVTYSYVNQDNSTISGTTIGSYYVETTINSNYVSSSNTLNLNFDRTIEFKSGDGNDTILDFSTSDTLHITSGKFKYSALSGNNVVLYFDDGSINLKDFKGKNVTMIDQDGNLSTQIYGSNGSTIYGSNVESHSVKGTPGDDLIIGSSSDETFMGNEGNDTMYGNYGNNVFMYSEGNDVIADYSEGDVIYLNDTVKSISTVSGTTSIVGSGTVKSTDIVFNFKDGSLTVQNAAGKKVSIGTSAQQYGTVKAGIAEEDGATLDFSLNTIAKTLDASSRDSNVINLIGNANDNVIITGNANATVNGANGNDSILSGKGNDSLNGGAGNDTLDAQNGSNTMTGGDGSDVFMVNATSTNLITDYNVGDVIYIGSNSISAISSSGTDLIMSITDSHYTNDVTLKAAKTKKITVEENNFTYNQILTATEVTIANTDGETVRLNPNAVSANAANRSAALTIITNNNDTTVKSGSGKDSISSGSGNNYITSGKGNDTIHYTGGNDTITDYSNGDVITFANNIDFKNFTNSNYYYLVSGNDVEINTNAGTLTLLNAKNLIINIKNTDLSATDYCEKVINNSVSNYDATEDSYIVTIDGSTRTKGLEITANANSNIIKGTKGNDTINGNGGTDTITTGNGKDLIVYSTGNILVNDYTTGSDSFSLDADVSIQSAKTNDKDIVLTTSNGNISIVGALTNKNLGKKITINNYSQIYGGTDSDTLVIANADIVSNGTVDISNSVNSNVKTVNAKSRSAKFAVNIIGNSNNNSIIGGAAADTLNGNGGNDTLTGNGSNDTFIAGNGNVTITDYTAGDVISLTSAITKSDLVNLTNPNSKSDVKLTLANGNTILLQKGKGKIVTTELNSSTEKLIYGEDYATLSISNANALTNNSVTADNSLVNMLDASKVTSTAVSLTGNQNDNILKGGAKNDTIYGVSGTNTLVGGKGNDLFILSGSDFLSDYFTGTNTISLNGSVTDSKVSNKDVILTTSNGTVTIVGGKGKAININGTSLTYSDSAALMTISKQMAVTTTSYKASDYGTLVSTLNAAAATNEVSLIGSVLRGGSKDDTLTGDTLTGNKGNDTFVYTGNSMYITDYTVGQDIINIGSANVKSASASANSKNKFTDLKLTMSDGGNIIIANGINKQVKIEDSSKHKTELTYSDSNVSLILTNASLPSNNVVNADDYSDLIKEINGTKLSTAASIVGNNDGNVIRGGSKNDTLTGGTGDDLLVGGGGADIFIYSGGNDTISDYSTADKIIQATVTDSTLTGNNVKLTTPTGNLIITKGKGKTININGNDLTYGNGDATLTVTKAMASTLSAYSAADYSSLVSAINASAATTAVTLTGNATSQLIGGKAVDTLIAGSKANTLTGGAGKDLFVYNGGDDLFTDYSADTINALTVKSSEIKGSALILNDKVTLSGAAKKSITINDGENVTTQIYGNSVSTLVVSDNDNVTADLTSLTNIKLVKQVDGSSRTKNLNVTGNSNVTKIISGSGNDILIGSKDSESVTLTGGKGSDNFSYAGGNIYITDYTPNQKDVISLSSGFTVTEVDVEDGAVVLSIGNAGVITVAGASGRNLTVYENGADTATTRVYGSTKLTIANGGEQTVNANTTVAYSKLQTIDGSKQTQALNITANDNKATNILGGSVSDILNGGAQDDVLKGNAGNDRLYGNNGNDILYGGAGNDTLYGGNGNDIFVFTTGDGSDIVADFDELSDYIRLGSSATKITNKQNVNGDLVLTFNRTGGTMTLKNKGSNTIRVQSADGKSTTDIAAEANVYVVEDTWFTQEEPVYDDLSEIMDSEIQIGKIDQIDAMNILTKETEWTVTANDNINDER